MNTEEILRAQLVELAPATRGADWNEVLQLAGAGERRDGGRLRLGLAFALLAALVAVCIATPLGAAIAHSLGGFSNWISGEPGSPAPKAQQQAFARANAHSFLGFPTSTQLRVLETVNEPGGSRRVQLLGFRAGQTLCLRVVIVGTNRASRQSCAPLAELRHTGAPARAILVDQGFGTSKERVWYGINRYNAPALQLTAGIAADGVKSVTLHDAAGTHTVAAISNGFLYVSWHPGIGQRVDAISAHTAHGVVDVPFAAAPWGGSGNIPTSNRPPTGPTKVQRVVKNGTISWLVNRQRVGQPLSDLRPRLARSLIGHTVFGRLLDPNPGVPARYALTLSTVTPAGPRTRIHQPRLQVCGTTFTGGDAGGGCTPLKGLFSHGPISASSFLANGADEFMIVSGFVSDDVHRLIAYLARGGTQPISIAHNTFIVSLSRARFPVRLVAYDKQGRIIGITPLLNDLENSAGPAPGKARPLLHATSPSGATGTLLVGKSNQGGNCFYVRFYQSKTVQGASSGCLGRTWNGAAVQLGGGGPVGLWYGRVKPNVVRVVVTFGDGRTATIHPTDGLILYPVPASERSPNAWVAQFRGFNSSGQLVGTEKLKKP